MSPSVVLHFIFRDRFPMELELTSSTCLLPVSPWDLPLFPSPVPVAGFHVSPGASHDYRTGTLPTECLRSPKLITF